MGIRLEENNQGELEKIETVESSESVVERMDVTKAKEEARKLISQREEIEALHKAYMDDLDAVIKPTLAFIQYPNPSKIPTLEDFNKQMPSPTK